RGTNWSALRNNFPTVPVDDIQIQARENDLVLATHGRSFWVFDDLTPIEKFDSGVAASDFTFFPPRTSVTYHLRQRRWSAGHTMSAEKNPPSGAILTFYLRAAIPPDPSKDAAKKDAEKEKTKNKEASATKNKPQTPPAEDKPKAPASAKATEAKDKSEAAP